MHRLAFGPKRKVHTWPIYFVNGFKFHTEESSVDKKTINCGVCVKGDEGVGEKDYYGIIKEIIQVSYLGGPTEQLFLFNCEWFDVDANRGVKVHPQYGIVEVHRRRRYAKYDPFILATNAIQVYYVPYPKKIKGKVDWWVVIKTKPKGTVDNRYTLEVAYQESTTNVEMNVQEAEEEEGEGEGYEEDMEEEEEDVDDEDMDMDEDDVFDYDDD